MKATREELQEKAIKFAKENSGLDEGNFDFAVELLTDFAVSLNSEPDEGRAIGSDEQKKEDLCPQGGAHVWQQGIGTRYCRNCGNGPITATIFIS